MNVHVPAHVDLSDAAAPPADKLPVMVWLHGGFFFRGAGTNPETDGEVLARNTQSIVVGVNYRVGESAGLSGFR